jgi:hypothetical protein
VQLALKPVTQQTSILIVVNHSKQSDRTLVEGEIKIDFKFKNLLGIPHAVAEVKIFVKCRLKVQNIKPIWYSLKFQFSSYLWCPKLEPC